jgi:hypothetical protein
MTIYRIPNYLVSWDPEALEHWVRSTYDCVEEGGQLHLFSRKSGDREPDYEH